MHLIGLVLAHGGQGVYWFAKWETEAGKNSCCLVHPPALDMTSVPPIPSHEYTDTHTDTSLSVCPGSMVAGISHCSCLEAVASSGLAAAQ